VPKVDVALGSQPGPLSSAGLLLALAPFSCAVTLPAVRSISAGAPGAGFAPGPGAGPEQALGPDTGRRP